MAAHEEKTGGDVLAIAHNGNLSNEMTMTSEAPDWLSLIGVTTMVFILVTLLAAFVVSVQAYWVHIAVRVAGSWIIAVGLLSLGWLVCGNG
jgi:hypothetical protein